MLKQISKIILFFGIGIAVCSCKSKEETLLADNIRKHLQSQKVATSDYKPIETLFIDTLRMYDLYDATTIKRAKNKPATSKDSVKADTLESSIDWETADFTELLYQMDSEVDIFKGNSYSDFVKLLAKHKKYGVKIFNTINAYVGGSIGWSLEDFQAAIAESVKKKSKPAGSIYLHTFTNGNGKEMKYRVYVDERWKVVGGEAER